MSKIIRIESEGLIKIYNKDNTLPLTLRKNSIDILINNIDFLYKSETCNTFTLVIRERIIVFSIDTWTTAERDHNYFYLLEALEKSLDYFHLKKSIKR